VPDVRILAGGLGFPEGPVWMADGSVILGEISGRKVTRVAPDGSKTEEPRFVRLIAALARNRGVANDSSSVAIIRDEPGMAIRPRAFFSISSKSNHSA